VRYYFQFLIIKLILLSSISSCGDKEFKEEKKEEKSVMVPNKDNLSEKQDINLVQSQNDNNEELPSLIEEQSNLEKEKVYGYNPDADIRKPKIGDNLIVQCKGGGNLHLFNCHINEGVILDTSSQPNAFKTYRVTYRFPCKGHDPIWGVKVGNANKRFKMGEDPQTLVISGMGNLELVDIDRRFTRNASLITSCQLMITNISYKIHLTLNLVEE